MRIDWNWMTIGSLLFTIIAGISIGVYDDAKYFAGVFFVAFLIAAYVTRKPKGVTP